MLEHSPTVKVNEDTLLVALLLGTAWKPSKSLLRQLRLQPQLQTQNQVQGSVLELAFCCSSNGLGFSLGHVVSMPWNPAPVAQNPLKPETRTRNDPKP